MALAIRTDAGQCAILAYCRAQVIGITIHQHFVDEKTETQKD